jgi:hypothetical protein
VKPGLNPGEKWAAQQALKIKSLSEANLKAGAQKAAASGKLAKFVEADILNPEALAELLGVTGKPGAYPIQQAHLAKVAKALGIGPKKNPQAYGLLKHVNWGDDGTTFIKELKEVLEAAKL